MKPSSVVSKPDSGNSSATGGLNEISLPSSSVIVSLKKLKSNLPPRASPITDSGEPIKDNVSAFPSLRAGKFLLNEETIELLSPSLISSLFH